MSVTISGDTGISKVQDGVIVQADLASGVASTGPAFSAYATANQVPSSGVWTKIAFDIELYDTNNCYSSSRFTPNVAGYYLIVIGWALSSSSQTYNQTAIYKNGSAYQYGPVNATSGQYFMQTTGIVYCNGTTDYIEGYCFTSGSNTTFSASAATVYFQGALMRAA